MVTGIFSKEKQTAAIITNYLKKKDESMYLIVSIWLIDMVLLSSLI